MEALKKAIKISGSQASLAKDLGVAPQVVNNWTTRNNVPAQYCPTIERLTGVRCEELRPDVDWAFLRHTDCSRQQSAA